MKPSFPCAIPADARLTREEAMLLAGQQDLTALMQAAAARRDAAHGAVISYSPKVFIALTRACRNSCGYCTFRSRPPRGTRVYLTRDEVLEIAHAGKAAGCTEALITLGDKPELRYASARSELTAMGYSSTLDYVHEAAKFVLEETGLFPHTNPGIMTASDLNALRPVSISQGLMLEALARRLGRHGEAHYRAPDKRPALRLATIAAAGEACVPFTSGILIGIGETRAERIDALFALRNLNDAHGHIQEIIIQNFLPKPGTLMASTPPAPLDEHLWTVAIARLIFEPEMNIQAPPNLQPQHLRQLLAAGINDWGGISPVTPDHVNPEAPWPSLDVLGEETLAAGKRLVPRLALYPHYVREFGRWTDGALHAPLLRAADADGWPRTDGWAAGSGAALPAADIALIAAAPPIARGGRLRAILNVCAAGGEASESDIVQLFRARGAEFSEVCAAADTLRRKVNGDTSTYVVNRNINFTNVCGVGCNFCAFAAGPGKKGYDVGETGVAVATREAWARGATEVCMQGGIHPAYTAETYLGILRAVKAAAPDVHIHAFSPFEVHHGAAASNLSLAEYLAALKEAGLGSLPGTAAEVLAEEVRAAICPQKISAARWLEVIRAAHEAGLPTTATIMFGHADHYEHWARHLLAVRRLQAETGGFTEFVPLPFVHMETPLYRSGHARPGPTFREAVLMHAVARLVLNPLVKNIQASWVKLGADGLRACLQAGANDMGGTLMGEAITRLAGAAHGQEMTPEKLAAIAAAAGREAKQRTTLYGEPPVERVNAASRPDERGQ